jgi:hypothetical protein
MLRQEAQKNAAQHTITQPRHLKTDSTSNFFNGDTASLQKADTQGLPVDIT